MSWFRLALCAVGVLCAGVCSAEPLSTFGVIRPEHGAAAPIAWQAAPGVSVSEDGLRFTGKGAIKSQPLSLKPLRLYDLAVAMRRGPGTRNRFAIVFEDEKGVRGQRGPVWQCPEDSRPEWFPLSPYRQRYVQGLILPPNAKRVWLELTVDGPESPELAPYTAWELFGLEIRERQTVPFGKSAGANQLSEGNMEGTGAGKMPAGWGVWGQGGERLEVIEARAGDPAPEGRHFLRVHPGPNIYLAANGVPVKRGTAWQLSLWARGKGSIQMLAHVLDGRLPLPFRVGDPQGQSIAVDSTAWKRFEQLWFAESPEGINAQVVLGIIATGDLDVDNVQFQPYQD